MAADSRVGSNLIQKKYDNQLRRAVEAEDIFSQFRGDIKGESVLPGTAIVVSKSSGQTSKVMGLVKSLSGSGKSGRDTVSGSEEKLETQDFTAYANEFKHGTNVDKFGIDAVANKPYGLLQVAVPLLGEFMEKFKGTHRREAFIQRFSSNLTVAPSSQTQHINANFYVGGVAFSSQPAYSDTLSTYATNINTAIPDSPTSANQMTPAGVKGLEKWLVTQKKIKPMKDGKWVVTVPSNQKYILMDEDSGLGKHFSQSSKPEMALKGWVGTYGRIHFVEDIRSPMLTATDGASSTLVWTYTTVNDSRPSTGADNWDVSIVLGADGAIEYELEALHLEDDPTVEYGREKRTAAFANYGVNLLEYAGATDVRDNFGSAIAIWASEV
jgi:hypothetical protein